MAEQRLLELSAFVPERIRPLLLELPPEIEKTAEEVRLRAGYPPTITVGLTEYQIGKKITINESDLRSVLELASQYSAHSVTEQVKHGFISVRGGHRIGLCGEAITTQSEIVGFRKLSSVNMRIAREIRGIARTFVSELFEDGQFENTIIIAPPGAGKTTFLRDLIRCLSSGEGGQAPVRVGVADERGELSAMWDGAPQFDLGRHTDVMFHAPKVEGLLSLLRGMNPRILAVDEITSPSDIDAIFSAAGCGVSILSTAHGRNVKEMHSRPIYKELFEHGIFKKAILIGLKDNGERIITTEELK